MAGSSGHAQIHEKRQVHSWAMAVIQKGPARVQRPYVLLSERYDFCSLKSTLVPTYQVF
jgi:hypothetical protein